ncbi:MAG: hypothetical protein IPK94_07300 [Saprospiraceae bacterium]|nr:hypothetical protein [Saprospiraceae bacterium]
MKLFVKMPSQPPNQMIPKSPGVTVDEGTLYVAGATYLLSFNWLCTVGQDSVNLSPGRLSLYR